MKRTILVLLVAIFAILAFAGCESDAYVASRNVSQMADNFQIYRRAVFYNGITNEYILEIQGYLSIEDQGNQLEVTVKTEDGLYLKHFLGLSDNVTYFVEQLNAEWVSDDRYRVNFKPTTIVPIVDVRVGN